MLLTISCLKYLHKYIFQYSKHFLDFLKFKSDIYEELCLNSELFSETFLNFVCRNSVCKDLRKTRSIKDCEIWHFENLFCIFINYYLIFCEISILEKVTKSLMSLESSKKFLKISLLTSYIFKLCYGSNSLMSF